MIALTARGVARFLLDPVGALVQMRSVTPDLQPAIMALSAATLVMVIIDLTYGPLAFPHSVLPGGKRDFAVATIALVELARAFATAAVILIGARVFLDEPVPVAEAIWMTVPFALALVGFELLQMGSWLLFRATGLNLYGSVFLLGFLATILVLVASVRVLALGKDWLTVLPVAVLAWALGYFLAPAVLIGSAIYLIVSKRR